MDNIDKTGEELVQKLLAVKTEFIRLNEELMFSIRKDVVAVELKDILANNSEYEPLKLALENYIQKLYNKEKDTTNGE